MEPARIALRKKKTVIQQSCLTRKSVPENKNQEVDSVLVSLDLKMVTLLALVRKQRGVNVALQQKSGVPRLITSVRVGE